MTVKSHPNPMRRAIWICAACCALAGLSASSLIFIWGPSAEFPFVPWALITAAQIVPLVVMSVLSK